MRIRQIILAGQAVLLLLYLPHRAAWADNPNPAPPPAAPKQIQPAVHLNLYNLTLPRMDDKPIGNAAHSNGETILQQNKPVEQNSSATGLHWTTVNSHPGVGYQLDKNEDLRLHFGGHGATASYALHF
jgi:hypothetical protein